MVDLRGGGVPGGRLAHQARTVRRTIVTTPGSPWQGTAGLWMTGGATGPVDGPPRPAVTRTRRWVTARAVAAPGEDGRVAAEADLSDHRSPGRGPRGRPTGPLTRTDGLTSRHSFSFGGHYDPAGHVVRPAAGPQRGRRPARRRLRRPPAPGDRDRDLGAERPADPPGPRPALAGSSVRGRCSG